jgi:hypothetical protein
MEPPKPTGTENSFFGIVFKAKITRDGRHFFNFWD